MEDLNSESNFSNAINNSWLLCFIICSRSHVFYDLEKGKILYTKSEATIFIDTLGQAEVGVAYQGRIFICTIGNNLAASAKSYLNTACYLTKDNAARDASKK